MHRLSKEFQCKVMVDAALTGWGALVEMNGEIWEISAGWATPMEHSSQAEPRAAIEAVRWVRAKGATGRIALITDHRAICLGQERWESGYGGSSTSYWLNECFRTLYSGGEGAEFFYTPGEMNLAGGPSRNVRLGDRLKVRRAADVIFPSVEIYEHPYLQGAKREYSYCIIKCSMDEIKRLCSI